jgi:hypothetical protein
MGTEVAQWTVTRDDVLEAFTSTLWLPDTGIVDITLGTVAGNRMAGTPIWTLLVGAPSSGKTIMLDAIRGLRETYEVDTFTEAGLLSGASDGTPGVLPTMGAYGMLVFPDLTVLISKHSADKSGPMGVLRRVYDGHLVRRLGNGRKPIEWEGKAGCLGAVTEGVYLAELGVMGERFLYYRLPHSDEEDRNRIGREVLKNLGNEPEQRALRLRIVADFFSGLVLPEKPRPFNEEEQSRLVTLADLGARCRSPVVRDRYKGDNVELVPEAESPGRLAGALSQLAAGMRAMGTPDEELWRLIREAALGGIHPIRRNIIDYLAGQERPHAAETIAARCRVKESTLRRYLEDLEALEVVDRLGARPACWQLAPSTTCKWLGPHMCTHPPETQLDTLWE